MKRRLFMVTVFALLALTLMGCFQLFAAFAPEAPMNGASESASSGGAITDLESLVAYLEESGASVTEHGSISQPFFDIVGTHIGVDSEDVQVFEFADEQAAADAASTIPEDGSSFATLMVTWMDSPHFYHQGKLIVLYVGSDEGVKALLESALGAQFAGME